MPEDVHVPEKDREKEKEKEKENRQGKGEGVSERSKAKLVQLQTPATVVDMRSGGWLVGVNEFIGEL